MTEGRVGLRSNVVTDEDAWNLVPGEVLAIHRPDLLRRESRPTALQIDEKMYYVPCGLCGRRIDVIMREGCDLCRHGPTNSQLEEARALHRRSLEAVARARQAVAGTGPRIPHD